jgi:hypothetical protein
MSLGVPWLTENAVLKAKRRFLTVATNLTNIQAGSIKEPKVPEKWS